MREGATDVEMMGAFGRMVFASLVVVAIIGVVAVVGHLIEQARHRDERSRSDDGQGISSGSRTSNGR
jgi:hypothetical protein